MVSLPVRSHVGTRPGVAVSAKPAFSAQVFHVAGAVVGADVAALLESANGRGDQQAVAFVLAAVVLFDSRSRASLQCDATAFVAQTAIVPKIPPPGAAAADAMLAVLLAVVLFDIGRGGVGQSDTAMGVAGTFVVPGSARRRIGVGDAGRTIVVAAIRLQQR